MLRLMVNVLNAAVMNITQPSNLNRLPGTKRKIWLRPRSLGGHSTQPRLNLDLKADRFFFEVTTQLGVLSSISNLFIAGLCRTSHSPRLVHTHGTEGILVNRDSLFSPEREEAWISKRYSLKDLSSLQIARCYTKFSASAAVRTFLQLLT